MRLVRRRESNGKRKGEHMEIRTVLSDSTVVFVTVMIGARSSLCYIQDV